MHVVAIPALNNFLLVYSFMALAHTVESIHRYYHPCDVLGKHLSRILGFLCLKLGIFSFREEGIFIY